MKEPHIKGEAAPLWPRVMRRYSAMRRSVDRGSAGQPLSSEITTIRVPTAWSGWEGNTGSGINQLATPRPCGVVRTCACVDALCSRTGRSQRPPAEKKPERLEKACGHTSNVYVTEKSDTNIVPEKEPNNAVLSQDSSGGSGGKGGDQGEFLRSTPVTCTQRQEQTLRGLDRIRVAAKVPAVMRQLTRGRSRMR